MTAIDRKNSLSMGVTFHVTGKEESYYSYDKQNKSYYHFLTPFKVIRPAIKKRIAQIRPRMNVKGLSGKLVNTYIAIVSLEMSRRYFPKLFTWVLLNSIDKGYQIYKDMSSQEVVGNAWFLEPEPRLSSHFNIVEVRT